MGLAAAPLVLGQLLGDRREQLGAHQGRHGDGDRVLGGRRLVRRRPARLGRLAALRA
jgi:hypothetical protein